MIRKLIIKNIQSHEDTEINFSAGVNAITGSSCAGKTAILRALYWVIENRPSGVDILCSNWNKDSKGKIVDEMSATIVTDAGWIKRYRNSESNGYIVHYSNGDEHKLEAIKTDVPEEVSKFLNLIDVNVQKQMDSPFLLSESAPEAARYLNNIVHLDNIDTVLSNAERNKRDVASNLKFLEDDLKKKESELESYSFIDDANALLNRIENFSSQVDDLENEIENLKSDISKFDDVYDYSDEINLINEINDLNSVISDNNVEINELENDIAAFDDVKDYSDILSLIERIEKIEIEDVSDFENQIESFIRNVNIIDECKKEINRLKSELPSVCPTCGKALEDCDA